MLCYVSNTKAGGPLVYVDKCQHALRAEATKKLYVRYLIKLRSPYDNICVISCGFTSQVVLNIAH